MYWKDIFQSVNTEELIFHEAIKEHEIEEIEKKLSLTLSGALLETLKETNGIKEKQYGCWLLGNSSEIIEMHRLHCDFLMQADAVPPHRFLFFANNGCGEYFGFKIEDGQTVGSEVGIYYPIDNEFRIVAPDFKTWVVEWHTGLLKT